MGDPHIIRLTVPGLLRYRDVAVRAVAAACKLVRVCHPEFHGDSGETDERLDLSCEFDAEFVSAFSEIFNNIALHAYQRKGRGDIVIELRPTDDCITVTITDTGERFDISSVPTPALEALPEHGMGLHIAGALLDELNYVPGPPNIWSLTKQAQRANDIEADGPTADGVEGGDQATQN